MSTGVIFILGKGVTPILAYGVKSTWPQGSSAPGFSSKRYICEKITATFHTENGMSQLLKGIFYPVKD